MYPSRQLQRVTHITWFSDKIVYYTNIQQTLRGGEENKHWRNKRYLYRFVAGKTTRKN